MIILTPSSARQCPSRAGASGPGTERVGASESARRRAMLHAWKLEMGRRGSRHGGKGSRRMLDRHCGRGRVNHARRRDRSLAGRGRTGVSFAIVFSAVFWPLVRPGRATALCSSAARPRRGALEQTEYLGFRNSTPRPLS